MTTSSSSPSTATSAPTTSPSTAPPQTSVQVPTEPVSTTEEPSTATATASSSTEHDRDRRAPTSSTDGAGTLKGNTQATTASKPSSSAPVNNNNVTGTKRGKKPGILRKLKSVLLSCVGPSGAHETAPGKELGADVNAGPASETKKTQANEKVKDFATEPTSAAGASEKADVSAEKPSATKSEEPGPSASAGPTTLQAPQSLEAGAEVVTSPSAPAIPPQSSIPPKTTEAEEPVIIAPVALLPQDETAGVTSGAVVPPGAGAGDISAHTATSSGVDDEDESVGSVGTTGDGDETGEELDLDQEADDDEDRLIAQGGAGIPIGPDGIPRPLLPPIAAQHSGRKCLVLDLDETLVHSSFKSIAQADYVVPVEIEYHWHNVYVIKRPGVDQFLKKMGEIYEIVVYTASLSKYADPVLDKLDIHHVISHRLFREHCYNHRGTSYVKDLSQLGRTIGDTIILDNSPASYIFHPNNAVPVSSWFNDPHDTELTDMVPFLADLAGVQDVRGVLDGGL